MSDETADEPGAADTAPTPAASEPGHTDASPAKRATFEVPKWAALVVAGLLLLGVGFAIGWISAPGGGQHHREFPDGQGLPLPGGRTRPQFPGPQSGGTQAPTPRRVILGIATQDATGTTGAQVINVVTGTPADQAGLKTGDVITAVDSTPVTSAAQLAQAIRAHQPGDQVTLTITRNGASSQVTVKLTGPSSVVPGQPSAPPSPSA